MKHNERDNSPGRRHGDDSPEAAQKIMTATSLFGDKVYGNDGDLLGKITDFLLNIGNGRIQSVILEQDGFIGAGRRYFIIRLEALWLDTNRHAFILDQSRAEFETNPMFNEGSWPKITSRTRYSRSAKSTSRSAPRSIQLKRPVR